MREKVIGVLERAAQDNERITFLQLVGRVADEGDCLRCLRHAVRKTVNELEEEGLVALSMLEGYELTL
jgi:hypothetical protein